MKTNLNKYRFNKEGFTLVEILLAMIITTIIAAAINASYRQISNISNNIEQQRYIYEQSRTLISTFRDELSGLYIPVFEDSNSNQNCFTLSATNQGQELTFYTLTPSWNQVAAYSKSAKITYIFQKTNQSTTLTRKEQPYSSEKAIAKESTLIIDESLKDLTFQVNTDTELDENSWQETYSSGSSPPNAIKIQLKYYNQTKKNSIDFDTTFAIRCTN